MIPEICGITVTCTVSLGLSKFSALPSTHLKLRKNALKDYKFFNNLNTPQFSPEEQRRKKPFSKLFPHIVTFRI